MDGLSTAFGSEHPHNIAATLRQAQTTHCRLGTRDAHSHYRTKYGTSVPRFGKLVNRGKPSALPHRLYSEISAKNPRWKKIYDDLAKFRADANLWFQFTESTFDKYMQSQKW